MVIKGLEVKEDDVNEVKGINLKYRKIKEALTGLQEILRINFDENDFFYLAGLDNLEALRDNFIDILSYIFTYYEF